MRIREGRYYDDGIDFLVLNEGKHFVISSKINSNRTVSVEKNRGYRKNSKDFYYRVTTCIIIILYLAFVYGMYHLFYSGTSGGISFFMKFFFLYIIIMVGFLSYFVYMVVYLHKKQVALRFHMAAHKVLNFYEKNKKAPENLEEFLSSSHIRNNCFFSVFLCLMWLATFLAISLVLFNNIWAQLILCMFSYGLTYKMYKEKYFNGIQTVLFEHVGIDEIEVAIRALEKYIEFEQETFKNKEENK